MSEKVIWFRVSLHTDKPEEREFERVTESRLYYSDFRGRTRFENKISSYWQWYPTREKAQEAIDRRNANEAERERMNRIRDAAPELLAKLREVLDFYDALPSDHASGEAELLDSITALIAKATGEQP